MGQIFIALLVAFTSAVAYRIMVRASAPHPGSLRRAVEALLDYAGALVLFLTVNIVAGVAIILLLRGLTTRFIALYQLDDMMLVILSGIQGFVFNIWWRRDV